MTVIDVRIDLHCDDGCDRDSFATVVEDRGYVITLERECCGVEVEMPRHEFNEYLRDEE